MRRSGDGSDDWRRGKDDEPVVAGRRGLADEPAVGGSLRVEHLRASAGEGVRLDAHADVLGLHDRGLRLRAELHRGRTIAGQEGAVLDLRRRIGPVQPRVGPRDLREGPDLPVSHDGSRAGDRQRVRVRHADPGPVEVVPRPQGAGGGARRGGVRRRILHHLLHRKTDAHRVRLAGHVPVPGDRVLRRDDDRGVHPAEPAGGMETGRLGAGGGHRESHGVEARVSSRARW